MRAGSTSPLGFRIHTSNTLHMLGQRLSAWFGADHASGIVKDVLSGKERIIPFVDGRPCRTPLACQFAALNFVRVVFKHVQRARGSTVRCLSVLTEQRVLEEVMSPCEQLTREQAIQLEEMCRVPLFEGSLVHVATKYGQPSMSLFKQSLRQMQINTSPASAVVVSRNAGTTVCVKIRENSKDVFFVLDFALAPTGHRHEHVLTPTMVINTSLEQTAARLSGILPVDNHLMTRDRQWQAQLFSSCTICTFTPVGGILSSEAESSAINESVALLRIMGEIDNRGRYQIRERERAADRERNQSLPQNDIPAESSHRELWQRIPFDLGRTVTMTSLGRAGRVDGESSEDGPSLPRAHLRRNTAFVAYEQTKRHCRIFLDDESSTSTGSSRSSSHSYDASDEETHFECVICFDDIHKEDGIHLLPCAHGFCKSCLAGHVRSKIEEHRFPVFCPLCMAEQENARPSVVSGDLVQQLGVSEAEIEAWSELEMAHMYARVHCHRCDRSAFLDKEDYERREELVCPFQECGHTWCKNCQQSISGEGPKHSCDGSEELDYLVKQMGWKYCPKCRTPVQKNGGCNHMTCVTPGCNTHFCYRCGKQITRASIAFLVRSAVNAHFKQCTL